MLVYCGAMRAFTTRVYIGLMMLHLRAHVVHGHLWKQSEAVGAILQCNIKWHGNGQHWGMPDDGPGDKNAERMGDVFCCPPCGAFLFNCSGPLRLQLPGKTTVGRRQPLPQPLGGVAPCLAQPNSAQQRIEERARMSMQAMMGGPRQNLA